MTMRERIATGKLFTDYCEGLPEDRLQAKKEWWPLMRQGPDAIEERGRLMKEIFGKETKAWIEPPFYFCYGTNIEIGEGTYLNFNCNFVDDTKIIIGKNVLLVLRLPSLPLVIPSILITEDIFMRIQWKLKIIVGLSRQHQLSWRNHWWKQCYRCRKCSNEGYSSQFRCGRQSVQSVALYWWTRYEILLQGQRNHARRFGRGSSFEIILLKFFN